MIHSTSFHSSSSTFFFVNLNNSKHHSKYISNSVDSTQQQQQQQQQLKEKKKNTSSNAHVVSTTKSCSCGRRHFIGASGAVLLPSFHSMASELPTDPKEMLNRIHPPRAEWYEDLYALAMEESTGPYEEEIAGYKADLFTNLRGKSKVLEVGIGTGPNLKYYVSESDIYVFGIDPNKSMEKYAQAAAAAAGLPSTHFSFTLAVGESLPVSDASMDAVIGTLVLCSVNDVELALQEVKRVLKPGGLYIFIEHVAAKDGTTLRFMQNVFDPLQQIVSDGCNLTRETGKYISQAGFSDFNINMAFLPNASLIAPHIYGIASK